MTPERAARLRIAQDLAEGRAGVVHRRDLRSAGVTREQVRTEVRSGRWFCLGRHCVLVDRAGDPQRRTLQVAVWEAGSGAALDGAAALVAHGMVGFSLRAVDVSIPRNNRRHRRPGVRLHQRARMPPVIEVGLRRTRPEHATVTAVAEARSAREAALVVCLVVQQRIVPPQRLLAAWTARRREVRRAVRDVIDLVIRDVCDGAHSLGELDLGLHCRRRGLPPPSRQVVRRGSRGRVYLDAEWPEHGLVVEVDGGQHAAGLSPVDDALRQNEITLVRERVLRIPVVGFRLAADRFMDQIARALSLAEGANRG